MADWNSVSNSEFFMLFHTSSYIFCAKNLGECAIFYSLSISKFSSLVFFYQWQNYVQAKLHTLGVTPKNWGLVECSEPRKLSISERKIDLKLKRPEGYFPRGEYGQLSVKKLE